MAGVEEPYLGVAVVALECLRACWQEERIILAPYGEERRLLGAEVLVEFGIEGDVIRIVEEQVELDLVAPRARKEGSVRV